MNRSASSSGTYVTKSFEEDMGGHCKLCTISAVFLAFSSSSYVAKQNVLTPSMANETGSATWLMRARASFSRNGRTKLRTFSARDGGPMRSFSVIVVSAMVLSAVSLFSRTCKLFCTGVVFETFRTRLRRPIGTSSAKSVVSRHLRRCNSRYAALASSREWSSTSASDLIRFIQKRPSLTRDFASIIIRTSCSSNGRLNPWM
mmetsp:Transcript_36192/g.101981  ORF Transcript_36192/g.101981 Transcript_36192/m.101981 type:complete len:202 (-) Transcript_36192:460-1065(-)